MAVTGWGQLFIQSSAPSEAPVQVGSLWTDISGTATLKICTAIAPYTFTAITGSGSGDTGVDRVVETGTTRTIEATFSVVVAEYFAIEGTGILEVEGDGALAVI